MALLRILSLFPNKTLYKATISSSYNEYKQCFYNVNKPDTMSTEYKETIATNSKKQQKIIEEMVILVKAYCKKYPDEKICHFCNFITYDKYPHRLHETISVWMKDL